MTMAEEKNTEKEEMSEGIETNGEDIIIDNGAPEGGWVKKSKYKGRLSFPSFYLSREGDRDRLYSEGTFDRMRMPRNPHWAIAWSDLMMTMFILFTVMYVYKSVDVEFLTGEGLGSDIGSSIGTGIIGDKGGGTIGPSPESGSEMLLTKVYKLGRQTLDQEQLNDFATVDLAPDKTVRIILQSDLLFDLGKAELKPDAQQSLYKIIPLLEQTPYMINVVGHTDDLPIQTPQFPSNWELSTKRASEVARFLMGQSVLPEERFYISGHASYQPLRPNNSPENREANRRVELIITRDKPQNRTLENVR